VSDEEVGGDMTCRSHKLWSATMLGLAALVLDVPRWPDRPFLPRPSFAPTFFHPLLCALMALWRVPGEVLLNAQSVVGGVVGGVMGSQAGGELVPLSSVRSSAGSPVGDTYRLLRSLLRLILKWGRNDVLGDRLASSLGDKVSFEDRVRVRDLPCLDLDSVNFSSNWRSPTGLERDSRNGTRTESLISS
jgi:hypothetical protein